jgi:hypothetical protein
MALVELILYYPFRVLTFFRAYVTLVVIVLLIRNITEMDFHGSCGAYFVPSI